MDILIFLFVFMSGLFAIWLFLSIWDIWARHHRRKNARDFESILIEGEISYDLRDCHDCKFCRSFIGKNFVDMWCENAIASQRNLGYPIEMDCPNWEPIRRYEQLSESEKEEKEKFLFVKNQRRIEK